MSIRKHYTKIIETGISLLTEGKKTMYNQNTIVDKLNIIGFQIGLSSFNKACKGKHLGGKSLKTIALGLQEIIVIELGYQFDIQTNDFRYNPSEGWKRLTIEKGIDEKSKPPATNKGLTFHEGGRLTITQKVAFMATAKKNINIIGIRLRQFSEYFSKRSDAEFKNHITALLKNGVDIDCYLLSPVSHRTHIYFEDRAEVLADEKGGEILISTILEKFKQIRLAYEEQNYKGKLSIFTYKHIPQNYFLVIDGHEYNGKMQVSHYLYGTERSKAPVLEIEKKNETALFTLYMKSMHAVRKGAVLIK